MPFEFFYHSSKIVIYTFVGFNFEKSLSSMKKSEVNLLPAFTVLL